MAGRWCLLPETVTLYDAVLPQSVSHEAPADVELVRWHGADVSGTELRRAAAESGAAP